MTSNPASAPLANVNIEGHTVPACPLIPVKSPIFQVMELGAHESSYISPNFKLCLSWKIHLSNLPSWICKLKFILGESPIFQVMKLGAHICPIAYNLQISTDRGVKIHFSVGKRQKVLRYEIYMILDFFLSTAGRSLLAYLWGIWNFWSIPANFKGIL